MKSIFFLTSMVMTILLNAQNVGIGTSTPAYLLDVNGIIRSSGGIISGGYIGVNTTTPVYGLQVNDLSFAIYNTTDNKFWTINYSSGINGLNINEDGSSRRLVIANGGNVGINSDAPLYRLDINGTFRASGTGYFISNLNVDGNFDVDGSANIAGTLLVNGNKGVLYNVQSSTNLKYYTRETAFTIALAGHALSGEGSFGFASAGFTTVPVVIPGDIVSTGGASGQLYRVQMIIYGCTTTSCKVRLLNTSPNPIDYSITWNVVCIGN